MANVLSTDKKIAIIGALAEDSSIRSVERIAGVHRDTIMRLGVNVPHLHPAVSPHQAVIAAILQEYRYASAVQA